MPRVPRTQQKAKFKHSAIMHDEYERSMRKAVDEVISQKITLKKAAENYNLSKSTLHRKVQKYKAADEDNKNFNFGRQHGFKCIFNKEEEALLTRYLIEASQMCYGLTLTTTRELAHNYAIANSKQVPPSWHDTKKAGLEWMHNFRKQNTALSLRTPEATSLTRTTSFNKHNVGLFFDNLRDVFKYNFLPHQIYNCDETGVTNVHKPPKILTSISQKQVGKVTSGEKGTLVTMCATICANGNFVPPYFIFPRKNFKPFMLTGAPPGSVGAAHPSGWMTADNFLNYIRHFIKHVRCSKEDPVMLILDNHESHYDIRVLNLCKQHGIVKLTLPPHCSHKMQPLDVSCFVPFKSYYNKAVDNWMINHPGTPMTIYDIAGVVGTAFPLTFTPMNIIKWFEKAGISPFNSQIFSDSDYMSSSVTDRSQEISASRNTEHDENIETEDNLQNSSSELSNKMSPPRAGLYMEITSPTNKPPSPEPGSSNVNKIITPQTIRPHVKAAERKQSKRGRKRAKSLILTDTPIKDQLEKYYEERMMKKNRKETKKNRVKGVKRKLLDDSSSKSDVEEEIYCDSTDLESDLQEEDLERISVELNDYVLVKYEKKTFIQHYAGQVIAKESCDYRVSFLKRLPCNKFVFPEEKDEDVIGLEDIMKILPSPFKSGSTKRAACQLSFPVDLGKYNII